ncbi:MAG: hypothetical protein AB7D07_17205 [Desulfovibrionaceae bacterium]
MKTDSINEKPRKETTTRTRAREAELAEQLPLGITNNCDQTNPECDMTLMAKTGAEQATLAEFRRWYWGSFYPTYGPALGWTQEDGERVESRFFSEWKRGQFDNASPIPMEDRPEIVSPVGADDEKATTPAGRPGWGSSRTALGIGSPLTWEVDVDERALADFRRPKYNADVDAYNDRLRAKALSDQTGKESL